MTLKDKNGIALGNVSASDGAVTVDTVDGDITVNAGATVKSETAAVTLTADDNVAVNGTVDAKGGNATVDAVNGKIEVTGGKVLAVICRELGIEASEVNLESFVPEKYTAENIGG